MKKIKYSWNEIGLMIEELVKKIKSKNIKFDGVYGIPKGGLPIAVSVANKLNIPMLIQPTEHSLVVDDISDTGITLQNVKNKIIGCLFSTDWTKVTPDIYIAKKEEKNSWIIFPWEDSDNEQTKLEDFIND